MKAWLPLVSLFLTASSIAALAQQSNPVVISAWEEAGYRLDPGLDGIIPTGAKVERIAEGLGSVEGPVWNRKGGYLNFSDMLRNVIYKWNPTDGKVSVILDRAGFTGTDPTGDATIGPNGVALDPQGRLVFCASGDRQIVRVETDGRRTVLASQYAGKRLNGPNDLVITSNGSIYFTDTYGGLPKRQKDPGKGVPYTGVYLLKGGTLQLLLNDRTPNGIAVDLSEKHLYVNDSPTHTIWRYSIKPDNTIEKGEAVVTLNAPRGPGGTKLDQNGNIYASVAGGVWILSPDGKHLGSILFPQYISNIGFGDADGKTLYATARSAVYRIRLKIAGVAP